MFMNLDPTVSPGSHAIDSWLATVYPDSNGVHFANPLPSVLGGPDLLNAISAYDVLSTTAVPSKSNSRSARTSQVRGNKTAQNDPFRHWHFVTYGFSELFGKSQDNSPDKSGFGFELTFRVAESIKTKKANTSSCTGPQRGSR